MQTVFALNRLKILVVVTVIYHVRFAALIVKILLALIVGMSLKMNNTRQLNHYLYYLIISFILVVLGVALVKCNNIIKHVYAQDRLPTTETAPNLTPSPSPSPSGGQINPSPKPSPSPSPSQSPSPSPSRSPSPSPSPSPKICGSTCTSDSQCPSTLRCIGGICDNPVCPGYSNCTCVYTSPSPSPSPSGSRSSSPSPSRSPSPSPSRSPSPSPSPALNLVCVDLTRTPTDTLNIGNTVRFTCVGSASNVTVNHCNFRMSINGGAYSSTGLQDSNGDCITDTAYTIATAGEYRVQCQVCSSSDASHCTTWGLAGGWTQ
jgi:hypothetical protein